MSLHYATDTSQLTPLTATDLTSITTTVSCIATKRKDEFYSSLLDFLFLLATTRELPELPKAVTVLHNNNRLCKRTIVHVRVELSDWVLRTDADFVIPCS